MHKNWPVLTAGDASQRPLLGRNIVEINPKRHRAVIGVRPSRNVLMPFDDLARARPFVIELAAVEFDVWTDQIGRYVGQHGFGSKAPEIGMPVDEGTQP